jgi:RNA polymerase sigma-70 factor (ECF subfamily)
MNRTGQETYTLLQQHHENGLQLLYERYGKRLYGYAVTSWQLSEDEAWNLVYQALLKTISNYRRYEFESEKKFSSFVFSIFCNLLRHHYRDEKKRTARVSLLSFDEALFEEAKDNPTLQAEREVQAKLVEEFVRSYWEEQPASEIYLNCLQSALEEMEDWERILLLQRAQQVPYSEIAHFVNKPEDQLKVYHQRARKKLMQCFARRLDMTKSNKRA